MGVTVDAYTKRRVTDFYSSLTGKKPEEGTILKLYKKYGGKTTEKMSEAPHILVTYMGADFVEIDRWFVSHIRGAQQFIPERVEALLKTAYDNCTANGSTYTTLTAILNTAIAIEKKAKTFPSPTPALLIGAELISKRAYVRIKDENGTIVRSKEHDLAEGLIAGKMAHFKSITYKKDLWDIIERAEEFLHIKYDDSQKRAFELLGNGISILTGGPGTGKTTILKGLLYAWEHIYKKPIVLCAPTGRAAKVLRDATGRPAGTIHRTFRISPENPDAYTPGLIDEGSLIVVDETSMVDVSLAQTFLTIAMYEKAYVLLVGDADQLDSVGAGRFLRDLIDSEEVPVCRLEYIHRQAEGSVITENAHRVIEGKYHLLEDKKSFFLANLDDTDTILKSVLTMYVKNAGRGSVRIFTPVKDAKYKLSTYTINEKLHTYYRQGKPEILLGSGATVSAGDPVIITRNIYSDDGDLYNGDDGTVKAVNPSEGKILITVDGEDWEFSSDTEDIELAYAVTIHKAQGGSVGMAIIVLPAEPHCMLSRSLLYVAITRATNRCVLITELYSLEESVIGYYEHERKTMLAKLIKDDAEHWRKEKEKARKEEQERLMKEFREEMGVA